MGTGLWENRSLWDLACRAAKTGEHVLTLSQMHIFYDTFHTYLVMQQLASKIKTPTMQTNTHFKP